MTAVKSLIFDAGPLINFAMNGLLPLLKKLKQEFNGDFLITKEVKREVIDYPESTKRFELEAIQIKELFNERIIKHADITEQEVDNLRQKREQIMSIANNTFFANNKPIHLLDKGECAALALATILKQQSVLVIDERTTRMLIENPENLKKLLQKKLHTDIKVKKENFAFFKDFKVIRSTELAYIAHKKNLIELKDPKAYEAMLYALKYKGCSVSEEEIEEMKKF
jgi:predicted nucleic acid-binding protein